MMRSTIESLIQLPLQIPVETSVRLKNEADTYNSTNKSAPKTETVEHTPDVDALLPDVDPPASSKGYIKYPRYDFF